MKKREGRERWERERTRFFVVVLCQKKKGRRNNNDKTTARGVSVFTCILNDLSPKQHAALVWLVRLAAFFKRRQALATNKFSRFIFFCLNENSTQRTKFPLQIMLFQLFLNEAVEGSVHPSSEIPQKRPVSGSICFFFFRRRKKKRKKEKK